ncbi:LytR/AlgR family response regulator transcription factor [Flavobacterium proteolyticum]|uniref:Response regulator transcription factor n=1 Tax=Flavobacterium proteolyticum TaxID=2911683 RepID=A0ABR9WNT6_9FLAO|nr:response regulator transcription factor [Flavobacterium proteolyticum]MBE9575460.1 response regulator transcription factor [Flavobacterium proteolyticum]
MTKILIVEDQVLIANYIKNLLNDNGLNGVELAFTVEEATEKMNLNKPDIVLLDINLNGKDTGILWAKEFVENSQIIFITGQTEKETMLKAFEVNPVTYLTKPVKESDLIAAIELAKIKNKVNYVIVKNGFDEVKVNFEDILFLKSDKNYVDIQLTNRTITIRNTLDNFYKELDSDIFCRVHRSYVVNKSKVTQKKSSSLKINEFEMPISRNFSFDF